MLVSLLEVTLTFLDGIGGPRLSNPTQRIPTYTSSSWISSTTHGVGGAFSIVENIGEIFEKVHHI
jgi:hypothetical protein